LERTARALWYVGPGKAETREERLPDPGEGEVRVRARHGALSRGTERLVLSGQVPASEFTRMRAPFMAGAFPFPVKYGYATVGEVEAGPAALLGAAVFALHPHQTLFNLPAEAVLPVPGAVPPRRSVLAANMETALNAIWDGGPAPADRIAVVGAGVVGLLIAFLCRLPGAAVTLVDVVPSRAEIARSLGLGFATPDAAPHECDVVFEASGAAAGLGTALDLAGEEARVIEVSWFGRDDVPVRLGEAFHSRRLRIVSSQVGQVSPSHRPRWSRRRRLAAALDLLADPRLDALLAPAVGFDELPEKLPSLLGPDGGGLCQVIDYG
jgi:NADPH:quinone reductase-like Zn-dependent oxidoreductase